MGILNLQHELKFEQKHVGILQELALDLCEGRIASLHSMVHDAVQYMGEEVRATVGTPPDGAALFAIQIGVRSEPDESGNTLTDEQREGVEFAVRILQAEVNGHHDDVHTHLEEGILKPLQADQPAVDDDDLVLIGGKLLFVIGGLLMLRCSAASGRLNMSAKQLSAEDFGGVL